MQTSQTYEYLVDFAIVRYAAAMTVVMTILEDIRLVLTFIALNNVGYTREFINIHYARHCLDMFV